MIVSLLHIKYYSMPVILVEDEAKLGVWEALRVHRSMTQFLAKYQPKISGVALAAHGSP
jgi:hypothetical protein